MTDRFNNKAANQSPLKRQQVEDALLRLELLLKNNPESVLRLHINLNRKRGIKLLSDLFDTDEGNGHSNYS